MSVPTDIGIIFRSDYDGDLIMMAMPGADDPQSWEVTIVSRDGTREPAVGWEGTGGEAFYVKPDPEPLWSWYVSTLGACHLEVRRPGHEEVWQCGLRRSGGLCPGCALAAIGRDDPRSDDSERVAYWLGVDTDALVAAVGAGWKLLGTRESYDVETFVTGNPPEVMLCVGPDRVAVHVPRGVWQGHQLDYRPGERTGEVTIGDPDALSRLAESVAAATRARRREMVHCRYCQELTPPECAHDKRTCMACAERHPGVVH